MILSCLAQPLQAKVLFGVDALERDGFALIQGKRVGLITNHTGADGKGRSTIDLLHQARGVTLAALFSPEHGIRGKAEHGVKISDERDPGTGLPVYSLYGKTQRPTDEMLQGLDALVFDIQDIGTRFYTYSTTLVYCLEEAAKRNIEFIVLDRPNPITGGIVEGEPLAPGIRHFTAYLRVPVRHGMTMGELANYHNRTTGLNAKLTVVKLQGWTRAMWWDQAGLKFRPTSPNIRTVAAAALYPGVGCFEATNVAVGRGTRTPFEVFGAPWIDGRALADRLNFLSLPGFEFKPVKFTPKADLYKGKECGGVRVILADRNLARPLDLFYHAFVFLREQYPKDFVPRWEEVALVTGSNNLKKHVEMGQSSEAIIFMTREKAAQFAEEAKPYLLYESSPPPNP